MTMTPEEYFADERGDIENWAQLTEEETRKFLGLKKYYLVFEDKTEESSCTRAWLDLQTECPRLKDFKWYR